MLRRYTLSEKADQDVREIYLYSYETFGEAQADKYLSGMEESFADLANNPLVGRSCEWLKAGYHQHEYVSHVIFYRPEKDGIFIGRILHKSMNVKTEKFEEGIA